jgi:hypothetical protein
MRRTIGRVACIGAVAALIGAALFLLVERASGTTAGSNGQGFRGRHAGRWEEAADRAAARPGHGQRESHGEFSPGRGIGGLGVTAVQVGLVAGVVAGLQKRSRRRRHGVGGLP